MRWVLFGNTADAAYAGTDALDLRGRTDFLELLAVIRTRCRILVAPDSGVLTVTYYLADDFPLEIVSLWSMHEPFNEFQAAAAPPARRMPPAA